MCRKNCARHRWFYFWFLKSCHFITKMHRENWNLRGKSQGKGREFCFPRWVGTMFVLCYRQHQKGRLAVDYWVLEDFSRRLCFCEFSCYLCGNCFYHILFFFCPMDTECYAWVLLAKWLFVLQNASKPQILKLIFKIIYHVFFRNR